MISYKSVILLFFLSCNVIVSQEINDYFATQSNDLIIISPVLDHRQKEQLGTIEQLWDIGKKAQELWTASENPANLATHLYEIFKPVTRNFLSNVIDQILDDSGLLQSIACVSYKTNTFFNITLGRISLRLWSNHQESTGQTHTHAYYSKVITGYLLHESNNHRDIVAADESCFIQALDHTMISGRATLSLIFANHIEQSVANLTIDELRETLSKVKLILKQLPLRECYLPEIADINHHFYKNIVFPSSHWRQGIAEKLSKKRVIQIPKDKLANFKISAHEGTLQVGGQKIDNNREYLFVLFDDTMYAASKDFHHQSVELICHSSFTDYGPVDSVGVFGFDKQGNLIKIEAYSGHYAPTISHMEIAKKYLDSIGVNTTEAVLRTFQDRPQENK